jgi:small subunit ribosomal protein S1
VAAKKKLTSSVPSKKDSASIPNKGTQSTKSSPSKKDSASIPDKGTQLTKSSPSKKDSASIPNKGTQSTKPSKGEPQSMDELLSMYGDQFQARGLSQGDVVKGIITSKTPSRLTVDIGGKSEGVVAEKAFKEAQNYIKTLEVGEEIQARVIVPETPDGFTILSLRHSAANAVWKRIEEAEEKGTEIEVVGKGANPAGVTVDINGQEGFIPNSQLGKEAAKNTQDLIGKKISVKVINIDRDLGKIILSEKEVSEKENLELIRKAMKSVKEGEEYDGVITALYDFGAFAKIEVSVGKEKVSLEGLVHISELSWSKVGETKSVVSEREKVKVKVIGKKDSKLALSMKQIGKDPWDDIQEKYQKDTKVNGKVTRVTDFGVFIELESGVEGLLHSTKLPPGKKLNEGESVNVYIEEVEAKERRISLGLVLTEKPVGYR